MSSGKWRPFCLGLNVLKAKYKKGLKVYQEADIQHTSVNKHAKIKPWQKEVMTFIAQPSYWQVIWVVGQKEGEGKTFQQHYRKYYYSDQCVIATDIATDTMNLTHFLT